LSDLVAMNVATASIIDVCQNENIYCVNIGGLNPVLRSYLCILCLRAS